MMVHMQQVDIPVYQRTKSMPVGLYLHEAFYERGVGNIALKMKLDNILTGTCSGHELARTNARPRADNNINLAFLLHLPCAV